MTRTYTFVGIWGAALASLACSGALSVEDERPGGGSSGAVDDDPSSGGDGPSGSADDGPSGNDPEGTPGIDSPNDPNDPSPGQSPGQDSPDNPGNAPGEPGQPIPVIDQGGEEDAYRVPMRRLTHFEYANAVRDLLPDMTISLPVFPADESIDGFDNHWDALHPSELLSELYQGVAMDVAANLDPGSLTSCDNAGCAEDFINDFGRRAFRRPLTSEEVELFSETFSSGPGADDFDLGVRLTVAAMMQSASFLYRPELGVGEPEADGSQLLDPFETATRLSFLVWGSIPDDELLDAAGAGELSTADEIEAQVVRLLADDRARAGVGHFFSEWFKLPDILAVIKNDDAGWNDLVKAELRESAQRLLYDEVFVQGGSMADALLTTRYPVTSDIAELVGVDAGFDGWQTVEVDPQERAGILTHPAILGAYGYGDYPSPVRRGVFLMDRVLCTPPSPPPGDADLTPPEPGDFAEPSTNRERYDQVTSGDACQACHQVINNFGFAFENYDTLGTYRTQDNGFDVDASATVGSYDFDNAIELAEQLASNVGVARCATYRLMNYALGGAPLAESNSFRSDLVDQFSVADDSLQSLFVSLARDPRFSMQLTLAAQ